MVGGKEGHAERSEASGSRIRGQTGSFAAVRTTWRNGLSASWASVQISMKGLPGEGWGFATDEAETVKLG